MAVALISSRPAVSDRALASNVPTAVQDWGARDGRQGAYAPEEVLGATDSNEDVAMSLATGRETKAHCQACGIDTTASPNAEGRRAVWASDYRKSGGAMVARSTYSCVGNIGPQVGNIGPQAGNVGPQAAEAAGEDAKGVSGVGNIVPRRVEETEKIESAACVSSVGNRVPRGVKKTGTSAEVSLSASRVDNKVPHSETDPLRNMPSLETSPEDLNSSFVVNKDVLEGFTKQHATCLGSEVLKNPEDPVYPLVKEYSMRNTAYNKLNNATVPAQTPIPRKDVLLNNMSGCTLYSALDLVERYYQILSL
ncbi:LOW QUALITY PROTEIN: Polyprotein [Phytophthora palmivora]|uniref:Polyprotein n=1 Tax=Phytophthora palmivora TaxID=4796 RepID=A0A2P4YQM4_9STRA|nr:LOW QUALITY PROTEIN: Polyprotein [Phytophthora palmivora]